MLPIMRAAASQSLQTQTATPQCRHSPEGRVRKLPVWGPRTLPGPSPWLEIRAPGWGPEARTWGSVTLQ